LKLGGFLVVSDPPADLLDESSSSETGQFQGSLGARWPADALKLLGLEPAEAITEPFHFTVLHQFQVCPDRYPRRTGIPTKRPLF
jgi:16S rRNA (guanine527-N7)-methyltransferase